MKIFLLILSLFNISNAAWIMFSDGADTYIYNNASGEIYVRFNRGGKNYEDIFVKMPKGVIPNGENADKKVYNSEQNNSQNDLVEKMQDIQKDMFNKALE